MTQGANEIAVKYGQRPNALRLLNRIGALKAKCFPPAPLTTDTLLEAAKKNSAHGETVPEFISALQVLTQAVERSAGLDFVGRTLAKQTFVAALSNQRRISTTLAAEPEIEAQPIRRPVFVVGFPRTGTTFIHNLLALDGNGRAPKMWEVITPDVVSRLSETERMGRIKEAEKFVKFADYLVPQLKSIHELYPDGADECLKLIENTFISPHFCLYFDVPDYWDWLLNADAELFTSVYEYHKSQLQMLQCGGADKHWVLKTPIHLFFLDALLKVYPDACIVHMQRDPLECIPSFCSLVGVNRAIFSDNVDMDDIGKFGLQFYAESSRRAAAAIANAPEGSVINVQYRDFVAEPKATVGKIYDYFGMEYTDAHAQAIDDWLNNNPKNKHGVHQYTLEQFGLSLDEIRNSLNISGYSDGGTVRAALP